MPLLLFALLSYCWLIDNFISMLSLDIIIDITFSLIISLRHYYFINICHIFLLAIIIIIIIFSLLRHFILILHTYYFHCHCYYTLLLLPLPLLFSSPILLSFHADYIYCHNIDRFSSLLAIYCHLYITMISDTHIIITHYSLLLLPHTYYICHWLFYFFITLAITGLHWLVIAHCWLIFP